MQGRGYNYGERRKGSELRIRGQFLCLQLKYKARKALDNASGRAGKRTPTSTERKERHTKKDLKIQSGALSLIFIFI